jgi:TolB-like protein
MLAGAATLLILVAIAVVFVPRILRPRQPAPVAGSTPSILALPCQGYGAPEVAYLTDAVPSAISTLLGQVEGLEIMVPPTGLEIEKVHGDLAKIWDLYHAASFVVPSVSIEASRIVLNVQLVDAGSRRVLWSRQHEGARDSYNELAREAVDGIRQALKPAASPVVSTAGLAASSAAELAFREGKYFANRYNNRHEPPDLDQAIAAFTLALQLDPRLADAAAETALLFIFKFEGGAPSTETVPQVELRAHRALEIDPKCGKAWTALIMEELQQPRLNASKMLEYGLKAAAVAPDEAIGQNCFGISLSNSSLMLALEPYREAERLDPLYLSSALNEAELLSVLRRASEALPLVEKVLTIEPDQEVGLVTHALVLTAAGRYGEAGKALTRAEARTGGSGILPSEILMIRHTLEVERGELPAYLRAPLDESTLLLKENEQKH